MTDSDLEDFGQQIADACEAFLLGLQAISREEDGGSAVPLLLLEVSQLLLAGARLGAQRDFEPESQYQPDVGPDPDLDAMRMRLAEKLGELDTYAHNIEPYDPDTVPSLISDDLTLIATDVANGLRHFRAVTSRRRCGGGSTPTSPRGGTTPAESSPRCTRSSPTTGSTATSRARTSRSRPPRRSWTQPGTASPSR